MAFRFKKSIKILPGVRLNIGKKGINSVSVGKPGATVNINRKGTRTTVGLPGTGLSHSSYRPHQQNQPTQSAPSEPNKIMGYALTDWFIGFVIIILLVWVLIAAN